MCLLGSDGGGVLFSTKPIVTNQDISHPDSDLWLHFEKEEDPWLPNHNNLLVPSDDGLSG